MTTPATLAKREAIAAELAKDSTRSNRVIAAALGVSKSTVSSVRLELGRDSHAHVVSDPEPEVATEPEATPEPASPDSHDSGTVGTAEFPQYLATPSDTAPDTPQRANYVIHLPGTCHCCHMPPDPALDRCGHCGWPVGRIYP
jgi:hypothetical protein